MLAERQTRINPMLRDYQQKLRTGIYDEFAAGHRRVLAVLPTGGGKTRIMGTIAGETNGATVEIAHRQELVFQISMALAELGIVHNILAPNPIVKFIAKRQARLLGRSFVHQNAPHTVASIDTLNARADDDSIKKWMDQIYLWQMDEAHHGLVANKWGRGILRFKNAWGIGWTATPSRADRKGMRAQINDEGEPIGGLFHSMVIGPSMRELIDRKFLADYIIYGPPVSIDVSNVPISDATGDFKPEQLRTEAHKSTITGDLVQHYLKLTPGKLGASFVVDVALAEETTAAYQSAGVPATLITAKTPDDVRVERMDAFRRGDIKMIVNVDILGEGVDVPGIEVVLLGRPTESMPLYRQQVGRALRAAEGKTHGVIIDAVGNVMRHGLPDAHKDWTLDAPPKRSRRAAESEPDELAVTTCTNPACLRVYERYKTKCPHCKHQPPPTQANRPEQVDGDLTQYGPELLAQLRGEADRIVGPAQIPYGNRGAQIGGFRNWTGRATAQIDLRHAIAMWAGVQRDVHERPDGESYRLFYMRFGVDVATAKTLGAPEAIKLKELVDKDLWR
jgi:DNA repair protein RadD